MRDLSLLISSASLALATLAAPALAQQPPANPNQQNDLRLSNGADGFYIFSDPSVGFPTGTNPPDINGDFFWKVFPKEALNFGTSALGGNPAGTAEISGIDFEIADTDWTTSPNFQDMILARGIQSVANPGNIEPDFNDPNSVFISLGASGLPNPCVVSPGFCGGGPCPLGGAVGSYRITVQLGSGVGDGVVISANGTQDYTWSTFFTGGMTSASSSATSTCGLGDYVSQAIYSSDVFPGGVGESQPDWLFTNYSAYSGIHLGNLLGGGPSGLLPDPVPDTPDQYLEFRERILTPLISVGGAPAESGLVTLNPPVTDIGGLSFGFESYAYQSLNSIPVCVASFLPPGPLGGGAFQGLLLNPTDPTFGLFASLPISTGQWTYFPDNGQTATSAASGWQNARFQSSGLIPFPPSLVSFQMHIQAADVGSFPFGFTNAFTMTFQ